MYSDKAECKKNKLEVSRIWVRVTQNGFEDFVRDHGILFRSQGSLFSNREWLQDNQIYTYTILDTGQTPEYTHFLRSEVEG